MFVEMYYVAASLHQIFRGRTGKFEELRLVRALERDAAKPHCCHKLQDCKTLVAVPKILEVGIPQ